MACSAQPDRRGLDRRIHELTESAAGGNIIFSNENNVHTYTERPVGCTNEEHNLALVLKTAQRCVQARGQVACCGRRSRAPSAARRKHDGRCAPVIPGATDKRRTVQLAQVRGTLLRGCRAAGGGHL